VSDQSPGQQARREVTSLKLRGDGSGGKEDLKVRKVRPSLTTMEERRKKNRPGDHRTEPISPSGKGTCKKKGRQVINSDVRKKEEVPPRESCVRARFSGKSESYNDSDQDRKERPGRSSERGSFFGGRGGGVDEKERKGFNATWRGLKKWEASVKGNNDYCLRTQIEVSKEKRLSGKKNLRKIGQRVQEDRRIQKTAQAVHLKGRNQQKKRGMTIED